METFKGNIYIYIPCIITNPDETENALKEANKDRESPMFDFLNEMASRSDKEIIDSMRENLRRLPMGTINILCSDTDEETSLKHRQFSKANWVLTIHERTRLAVACIVVEKTEIPATQLLDQVSKEQILYKTNPDDKLENFEQMLKREYLMCKSGTTRVCLSTRKCDKPSEIEIQHYFACETYNSKDMRASIKSSILNKQSQRNLAQYDSSEIFIGKKSILRVDCREECQESGPTFFSDCAFLFIVELMILKDAAISRTHRKVLKGIADGNHFSLQEIDNYSQEFSTTTPFWSLDIFRYTTAQRLANNIDLEFGTSKDFENYFKDQRFLEHRINLKNALAAESENQMLNVLAILVFIFEAVPASYHLLIGILNEKLTLQTNMIASLLSVSFVSILLLLLIKLIKRKNSKRLLDD